MTHKSEEISSMKCLILESKTSLKPKFVNQESIPQAYVAWRK